MKRQRIYVEDYDWVVEVFYDTRREDAPEILSVLRRYGCSGSDLINSRDSLTNGQPNTGLTYSNSWRRESVMVIGATSSLAEFLNTWQHEMTHLQRHICKEFDINPYSEEAAYLAGGLAQQMYPLLSVFMCGCNDIKHG